MSIAPRGGARLHTLNFLIEPVVNDSLEVDLASTSHDALIIHIVTEGDRRNEIGGKRQTPRNSADITQQPTTSGKKRLDLTQELSIVHGVRGE